MLLRKLLEVCKCKFVQYVCNKNVQIVPKTHQSWFWPDGCAYGVVVNLWWWWYSGWWWYWLLLLLVVVVVVMVELLALVVDFREVMITSPSQLALCAPPPFWSTTDFGESSRGLSPEAIVFLLLLTCFVADEVPFFRSSPTEWSRRRTSSCWRWNTSTPSVQVSVSTYSRYAPHLKSRHLRIIVYRRATVNSVYIHVHFISWLIFG